jgi:predicted MFS family arabinose efflux permease
MAGVKLVVVIALTVLSHTGFVGSRVVVSLYAISQNARPLTIGILLSLYALLPMLLAVWAGRLIDRVGVLRPMAWAGAALVAGIALPFAWPSLDALFIAATVMGTAFMFYHVGLNHTVGRMGTAADRAINFSWFALGFSIGGFCGPLLAGFAIDALGHRFAFALLAAFPAAGLCVLYVNRHGLPAGHTAPEAASAKRVADLLREPRLRAAFIVSGLLAMGWDLYTFAIPIYGSSVGLSASTIGIVMGSFAAATFTVRMLMPAFARRAREWTVVALALAISGTAYSMFPFFDRVPMLMALSFLLGLGLGCAQPMIMSLLYAASPAGRQGEAVGVRTTMMNASHTFLPLVFGTVAALGMAPVFWSMSALLLSGAAFVRWRARRAS